MSWLRVDDRFPSHPKVERLEDFGERRFATAITVWLFMGTDCAGLGVGGIVTEKRMAKVLSAISERSRKQAAADLVEVGLWETAEGETGFHDWEEYRAKARSDDDAKDYEAKRKAAWRARNRVPGTMSGTSPGQVPEQPKGTEPPLLSRPIPTYPDPTQPVLSQSARDAGIDLLPHLHAEWRRVHTNAPGTGSVETLAKVWRGEPAPTHAVRGHLDRVKLVLEAALAETDPKAWITRTIEGFARDPYAKSKAAGFELYASKPGSYAKGAQVLSSAPSAFDDAPPDDAPLPACLGGPD